MSSETIARLANSAKEEWTAGSIADCVPKFKDVNSFTTFRAEYALIDDNIVVHFFLPPDFRGTVSFWKDTFPTALASVAPEHFQAVQPRLVAAYTEEMKSWWLRARNYGHIIDLDAYMLKFFSDLDNEIDSLK